MVAQFFVDSVGSDNSIIITGKDFYHLTTVRRASLGDAIQIIDNNGIQYHATITQIDDGKIVAIITEKLHYPDIHVQCTLCTALLKGKKFDLVIQKAVEIGVKQIIPVVTQHTIPDVSGKEDKKVERWQLIASEASKQCLRKEVPPVHSVMPFEDVIKLPKEIGIMAHADPKSINLRKFLKEQIKHNNVMLLIGPEGGFSKKEVEIARQYDWFVLYNGATQLRAETAAIVLPAIILYEWGYE